MGRGFALEGNLPPKVLNQRLPALKRVFEASANMSRPTKGLTELFYAVVVVIVFVITVLVTIVLVIVVLVIVVIIIYMFNYT